MTFIVYNPTAGRGRARAALVATETHLAERTVPYRVLTTTRSGHATEIVRTLPSDARVLAIGGDGTAHEVAAACVGTDRVLGIIPSGSGDDFAFALGIGRSDLRSALDKALAGNTRMVDVGMVNGVPFINAMGSGFDADVAAHIHAAPPQIQGVIAYLVAVVAALKDFTLAEARVDVDGQTVHDGPALLVSALNGPRTGGGFLFAPNASLHDGLLDVLIAGRFNRASALAILPKLMKGRHLAHPEVRLVRGTEIRISWSSARPFHMEGEVAGPTRDFHVWVRPKALRVLA